MKPFSDEELRAYFFGKLPEQEAEILEEECAASEELTEQAQAVERELVDEYLRGNLSESDFQLFAANYPVTEARRNKIDVARGLWKIAGERTPTGDPPAAVVAGAVRQNAFGNLKGLYLAFGGLVLLLFFGALAFYLPSSVINRNDVAEVKDPKPPPTIENPVIPNPDSQTIQNPAPENPPAVQTNPGFQNEEAEKDSNSPQKNSPATKSPSTPKIAKPDASGFAAFVLAAGTLRGEGEQSITIAPNVKNLNLLLSPAGGMNDYKIRRAVLKTAEGNTVFIAPNLKSFSFKISADKLENRTYIVFLEGQNARGEFESIAEYTFRVRR